MNLDDFGNIRKQASAFINSIRQNYNFRNVGLALSLLSIEDFRRSLKQEDGLNGFFTDDEIAYCNNRPDSLAGRYAAKLAVREVLGKQIPWKQMNILPSQTQQPVVSYNTEEARQNVSLSITHEDDLVAAAAVSARENSVVAVGIDATKTSRITGMLRDQPHVLSKVLTPQELLDITDAPEDVAKKWAGKEAVSKALGAGIWHGASLQDVEILTGSGSPEVVLSGKWLQKADERRFRHWELGFVSDEKFTLALVAATSQA